MQLLLIDNRINNVETVTDSLLDNVEFVLVDFYNDTYDTLISKIQGKKYDSVGIFQENYELDNYQLVYSFTNSILKNINIEDTYLEISLSLLYYELLAVLDIQSLGQAFYILANADAIKIVYVSVLVHI